MDGVRAHQLHRLLDLAALQNAYYYSAPYLSPMYSPCLAANCDRVTFPLVGDWFTLSPAFLILWAPGVFRVTCYYHREAYYRSFWGSPPGCAVQDVHDSYSGETGFPLILQNLHRYAWYLAVVFIFFLSYDALIAFRFPDGFGIGVGTLVICLNVMLLAGYTFSCHSCRHVCGGHVNQFSKARCATRSGGSSPGSTCATQRTPGAACCRLS